MLPVSGIPLFAVPGDKPIEIAGYQAYLAFNYTIELIRLIRQQGNSQLAFRTALEGLRNYTLRYDNWRILATRTAVSLNAKERRSFDNATRIYFRNEDVRDYNEQRLRNTNNPVIKLKAKYNDETIGCRASVDECSQLEDKIEVAISCKIMLLTNI